MWLIHGFDRGLARYRKKGKTTVLRTLFDPTVPTDLSSHAVTRFDVAMLSIGLSPIVLAVTWPEWFAETFGPIGATVALLGAWSLVFGTAIVSMQRRKPLAVFRAMGLRSTPVITIVMVVLLVTSTFANTPELHAVRTLSDQTTQTTETSRVEADRWAEKAFRSGSLGITRVHGRRNPPPPYRRRRRRSTRRLLDGQRDGRTRRQPVSFNAALVASGISGGSVGLAINQVDSTEWGTQEVADASTAAAEKYTPAERAVANLTGPDPLARALTGLLGGDLIAGATGLRFPTEVTDADGDPRQEWIDRAGHLERGWERETKPTAAKPSPLQQAMTYIHALRRPAADPQLDRCGVGMPRPGRSESLWRWARARSPCARISDTDAKGDCSRPAMDWPRGRSRLSSCTRGARKICVGPLPHCCRRGSRSSPRAADCRSAACGPLTQPEVQLVDGGYGDPTGLSTMAEIAPAIVAEVAQHNLDRARPDGGAHRGLPEELARRRHCRR